MWTRKQRQQPAPDMGTTFRSSLPLTYFNKPGPTPKGSTTFKNNASCWERHPENMSLWRLTLSLTYMFCTLLPSSGETHSRLRLSGCSVHGSLNSQIWPIPHSPMVTVLLQLLSFPLGPGLQSSKNRVHTANEPCSRLSLQVFLLSGLYWKSQSHGVFHRVLLEASLRPNWNRS